MAPDPPGGALDRFDPVAILEALTRHGVRFVVIGGIAAAAHGYPLPTEDLDITPSDDETNLKRLAGALADLGARLRVAGQPDGVEVPVDAQMLARSAIWTTTTVHGDLDISFLPAGTQGYRDLRRHALTMALGEEPAVNVLVASLLDVIRSKEAANRPKDRAQLPALRQTLETIRRRPAE